MSPSQQPPLNAWIIPNATVCQNAVDVSFTGEIDEGDHLLLTDGPRIGLFARIHRKRIGDGRVTLFFEAAAEPKREVTLVAVGIAEPEGNGPRRLDWSLFIAAMQKACGFGHHGLTLLDDQAYLRQLLKMAVIDDLLGPANGPEEEIVGMSVRDRYLVGKLSPKVPPNSSEQPDIPDPEDMPNPEELQPQINDDHVDVDHQGPGVIDDQDEEESTDNNIALNQSLVPSSIGLTFCIDSDAEKIEVVASWGRYEREVSETAVHKKTGKPLRCWKRYPAGGSQTIPLTPGEIEPIPLDDHTPDVVLQGKVYGEVGKRQRLVALFLVNNQIKPDTNQDATWIFQPELIVRDPEGRAIFRKRPVHDVGNEDDPDQAERIALEMVYRNRVEFAIGHGVSVHATTADNDPLHATEIRTTVVPQYEVPVTETPGSEPEDRPVMRQIVQCGFLDMNRLAEMPTEELVAALSLLTDDYTAWIAEQRSRIGSDVVGFDRAAGEALDRCGDVLERLREGIGVLETNEQALTAFRFMNRAMAAQRVHGVYSLAQRRGETKSVDDYDIPKNRTWRPFQLAFVLLSIPALADPTHEDRTQPVDAIADLLWFPTGGGKTEAYLGASAFAIGIRRLQGEVGGYDGTRGLSVIMRYTLRLLTIQQFQRAAALICAMETIRRSDPKQWGTTPFTIGLWVGQSTTPNTTAQSNIAVENERDGKFASSTPAQLTTCPWCGSEIAPGREIKVDKERGKTIIYCGDRKGRCEFSKTKAQGEGLPVVVVDEEIYRRPPSMLIATVDKFAMMAWKGESRNLFGYVSKECPRHGFLLPDAKCTGKHTKSGILPATTVRQVKKLRPPDLIIQDEFHLISGPLGTLVGLYESAVDELASWKLDGKTIKPKIVASTATVRKADSQINNVFLRKVSIFPPHGLDIKDNFFSVQRSTQEKPGRQYMGICSPGSSRPAVLIRVYVAFLSAAKALFDKFGEAADPYMTLVGYFNSLRELGGMRRLAEDDVQTRSYRVKMSDVLRPGLAQRSIRNIDELTSRVSSKDIPKKLDQLEIKFKENWEKGEVQSTDVVLATNMLSVGVDVNRIGLMVVNGQPKNTAEYIQATSRVGRAFPGIVCTVLTWSRPRDFSHFETYEHYHACFYKHVESQSVTPFAPRALDRGLTGTMVSLMRLENEALNANEGAAAMALPDVQKEVAFVPDELSARAWRTKDKEAGEIVKKMVDERLDLWAKEARKPGRTLGYEKRSKQGTVAPLLKKPGFALWDELTVPQSMREVEPGVRLILEETPPRELPDWQARPQDDGDTDSDSISMEGGADA